MDISFSLYHYTTLLAHAVNMALGRITGLAQAVAPL